MFKFTVAGYIALLQIRSIKTKLSCTYFMFVALVLYYRNLEVHASQT